MAAAMSSTAAVAARPSLVVKRAPRAARAVARAPVAVRAQKVEKVRNSQGEQLGRLIVATHDPTKRWRLNH